MDFKNELSLHSTPTNQASAKSLSSYKIKWGLILASALIAYFLLIINIGLIQIIEWRLLGFVIVLIVQFFSYKYFSGGSERKVDYLPGLWYGISISFIGIIPFAAFCAIYFAFVNPQQLILFETNALMMGNYITPFSILFTLIFEGMVASSVISFCLLQYYRFGNRK